MSMNPQDIQRLHLRMEPLLWISNIAAMTGILVLGIIVIHMIRYSIPYTIRVYQIFKAIEHVCPENHEEILDKIGKHFAKTIATNPTRIQTSLCEPAKGRQGCPRLAQTSALAHQSKSGGKND